jgi:hypothetical protein
VARAKGFRPMIASHKRSRPRKDHAGPVAHPEHPPKSSRIPNKNGHAILPLRMDPDSTQLFKPEVSYS